MKRLILITGVILIAYVVMTGALEPAAMPAAASDAAIGTTQSAGVYTLTEVDGKVAVLLDGALYIRTSVPVDVLPKSDRARLRQGVEFSSIAQMKRALEDYCG